MNPGRGIPTSLESGEAHQILAYRNEPDAIQVRQIGSDVAVLDPDGVRVLAPDRIGSDFSANDAARVCLAILELDSPVMGKFDSNPHAVRM